MGVRQFVATNVNGEDRTPELMAFAKHIGLEEAAPGRYSLLLVLHLFGGFASRRANPHRVVDQIRALERGFRTGTKPAAPLRRPPLRGLWHQHYLADGIASMAINLRNALANFGLPSLEQRIAEAMALGDERNFTQADISAVAHEAVVENWRRRGASSDLTGEWVIFAKHGGQNFYLCLGLHDEDHQHLRQQIDAMCLLEFPFLSSILS